eukprot:946099-Prymnesium_polylepis.1
MQHRTARSSCKSLLLPLGRRGDEALGKLCAEEVERVHEAVWEAHQLIYGIFDYFLVMYSKSEANSHDFGLN